MDRRDFLRVSVGFSLASHFSPVFASDKASKPNLLIIHTDEHNFRTLGCYRKLMSEEQAFVWGKGVKVDTPNIDWIADNGAICTSFYATTPLCSPSRSSFLSGKYPQNTPVHTNSVRMNDDIITFAEVLSKNGYATGYAGKWHLDGHGKPKWAPERKFGFEDNRYMYNRGHWKKLGDTAEGPRVLARDKDGKPSYDVKGADEKSFTTDYLADKTIDFIDQHRGEAFCYVVSIPDPHGPNTVRAPYDSMYDDLKFELPKTAMKSGKGLPSWAKKQKATKMKSDMMSKYFGMVKCIDDNVGRILESLRKNNVIDNTIVVFTADHGDLCYEHARHNKGVPMEGSAKIPFVIHYPGKITGGTVVDEGVGCVDFMPTVLKLMGIKSPGTEEGRDCSELLVKDKGSAGWKDVVFMRGSGKDDSGWVAAVAKRYKIVYKKGEEPWLYDLKDDPDELVNFYKDKKYAGVVKEMSAELIEYGKKYGDVCAGESLIKPYLNKLPNGVSG